jgi:hypothetical protein
MLGFGYWRDMAGKSMGLDRAPYSSRGFLYKSMPPGATEEVQLKAMAPENPGKYRVSIQMVDEFIAWFENAGGEKITAEIEVTP